MVLDLEEYLKRKAQMLEREGMSVDTYLPPGWHAHVVLFSPRDLELQGGDPEKLLALIDAKLTIARNRLIRDLIGETWTF